MGCSAFGENPEWTTLWLRVTTRRSVDWHLIFFINKLSLFLWLSFYVWFVLWDIPYKLDIHRSDRFSLCHLYGHYTGQPALAGNSRLRTGGLLVQSFTACMPLLTATSTFGCPLSDLLSVGEEAIFSLCHLYRTEAFLVIDFVCWICSLPPVRLQSIAMNAPVSLSALIFLGTTHSELLALPKAMARSSSGSVMICYLFFWFCGWCYVFP